MPAGYSSRIVGIKVAGHALFSVKLLVSRLLRAFHLEITETLYLLCCTILERISHVLVLVFVAWPHSRSTTAYIADRTNSGRGPLKL